MNQGQFAGRVGLDAKLKSTPSGKTVLNWSVGVDVWGGGKEKRTLWVNCTMWGERGERLAPILVKGTPVSVAGDVDLRTWEKDAKHGAALELRVNTVTLLGRAPPSAPAPAPHAASTEKFADDDLPF
jgi:single-strand DNA-binding protein